MLDIISKMTDSNSNDIEILLTFLDNQVMFYNKTKNEIYYILRNETRMKDNKLFKIIELLKGSPNANDLDLVVNSKLSVLNFLINLNNPSRVGQIAGKTFPEIHVNDMLELVNKLPEHTVFIKHHTLYIKS